LKQGWVDLWLQLEVEVCLLLVCKSATTNHDGDHKYLAITQLINAHLLSLSLSRSPLARIIISCSYRKSRNIVVYCKLPNISSSCARVRATIASLLMLCIASAARAQAKPVARYVGVVALAWSNTTDSGINAPPLASASSNQNSGTKLLEQTIYNHNIGTQQYHTLTTSKQSTTIATKAKQMLTAQHNNNPNNNEIHPPPHILRAIPPARIDERIPNRS
jgi:hypothetical protein